MTEKLIATVEHRRSGARLIELAGVLDEHNQLGELIEKLGSGTALINLSGVERINSIGARDWVNWLASLEANGIQPVLIACSPAVVAQLNRIKNFSGNASVKSFQVPYHCARCELDKRLLVYTSDLEAHEPPECACEACGGPMTVVDESASYFAFVRQLPKAKPATGSAPPRGSERELARGSLSAVSQPRPVSRISRPSFSAVAKRQSEQDIVLSRPAPRPMAANGGYVVAIVSIIAVLFGTVGVLLYMLIS